MHGVHPTGISYFFFKAQSQSTSGDCVPGTSHNRKAPEQLVPYFSLMQSQVRNISHYIPSQGNIAELDM